MSDPVVVTATRQDGWWAVRAAVRDAVVWTQTKRLDQVEDTSREAIALALDVPVSTVDVEVEFDIPADLLDLVEGAATMSAVSSHMQNLATRMNHVVAGELRNRQFSVRDIGMIMGVSPQRVSQLLAGQASVRGASKSAPARTAASMHSAAELLGEFVDAVTTAGQTLRSLLRELSR